MQRLPAVLRLLKAQGLLNRPTGQAATGHHKIQKYYQSTSKALVKDRFHTAAAWDWLFCPSGFLGKAAGCLEQADLAQAPQTNG